MLKSPFFAVLVFLAIYSCQRTTVADETKSRPNVVLIISDDHAWTDYQFMGHKDVQTPHIDRLAREGLTFSRGYVTTALCSPSLATLLTGLHPHQHGITGNDPDAKQNRKAWLDRFFKNPMLPKKLADAGYLTLHTGKYWMREPAAAGFTDSMGETDRHGGKALAIGRETMKPIHEFIDKSIAAEKPFFVWYAPFLPHTPHTPPERLLKKYSHIQPIEKAKYLAMVEWLDESCGDLMQNLKNKGVDEDTLIVYLADNGWNEFGKMSPYENGVRTPIVIRWPAKIKPRTDQEQLVQNIDIVPTILGACGVMPPDNLPGINLLDEKQVAARDRIFLAQYAHNMVSPAKPEHSLWSRSCIKGPWKLISWVANPPKVKPNLNGERHKNEGVNLELFNLIDDPHETKNLAAENPAIVKELQDSLDSHWKPDLLSTETPKQTETELKSESDVEVREKIVYSKVEGRELLLDAFIPRDKKMKPAVLVVHGGAWKHGNRMQLRAYADALANRGFACFAIDYRLAPKNKFPAQIEDCRAAVKWIRENAAEFRVDTERLGAIGYSAGGHLVCLLATTGEGPNEKNGNVDSRLKAVVAGGAPTDFRSFPDDGKWAEYLMGGTLKTHPDLFLQASATAFVDENDPPVFFFNGTKDAVVPMAWSLSCHEALKAKGVKTEMHTIKGMGHIQAAMDQESLDKAFAFLERELGLQPSDAK